MCIVRVNFLLALLACLFVSGPAASADDSAGWKAGFSRVVITPDEPTWMSGYAGRTAPAEGKIHDLYARVIALRDPAGHTAAMIATDAIGVPPSMTKVVSQAAAEKHGLKRDDLMFTCSHTHCGPCMDDRLTIALELSPDELAKVMRFQETLNRKLIAAIDQAIGDLQPAQLATGIGRAEFATNRRAPIGTGPIDQEVPVLRVLSADGKTLRGMVYGYACHNTVMGFQQYSGDYAGFASLYLEDRHPGATALFFTGCGADQNPLPRRKLELCEKYGRMLGVAVDQVLGGSMQPVTGELKTALATVDLDLARTPAKEELEMKSQSSDKYVKGIASRLLARINAGKPLEWPYPYPVQVWRLGNEVTWVALGGEVVVDYSLRLKRELGPGKTWVTGYANDVMAYIPSERVLAEGGYEGESSMNFYQFPSKWAPGLEEKIVGLVHQLAGQLGKK